MKTIPVISKEDVEGSLNWASMLEALKHGHSKGKAQISDQLLVRGDQKLLSRAAWIDGLGVAVKSVTVFPDSQPSVQGGMLLFNDKTGAVEALIDGALITYWKTAAGSVLGAKILARPEAKNLLIIGAGTVARSLISAYREMFPGIVVSIWNRTTAKAQMLATEMNCCTVDDLPLAVSKTDILACATMSKTPVFCGEWLRAGTHIDLIGAYTPDMREADDVALQRSRIFVDSFEATLEEIGELKIPLDTGAIARGDVLGDFHSLIDGTAGRISDDQITLFKNGGGAHLDLMIGHEILKAWKLSER